MHHVGWASRGHLVPASFTKCKIQVSHLQACCAIWGITLNDFSENAMCIRKESSWDITQWHQGCCSWRQRRRGDSHYTAISICLQTSHLLLQCAAGAAGPEQAPGTRWLCLGPAGGFLSMTGQTKCPEVWDRCADGGVPLSKAIRKMCWFPPFLHRLFTLSLSSDKTVIPAQAPWAPSGVEHSCEGQLGFPWIWSMSREKGGYEQKCLGTAAPNAISAAPVSLTLQVGCALSVQHSMAPSSSLSIRHHPWWATLAPQ